MDKAQSYREAAEALVAVCFAHDIALSDTGLVDSIQDVIDELKKEATEAEKEHAGDRE